MFNSQNSSPVLLAIVLAGGLAIHTADAMGWLNSLVGITLLLVLFAYDAERDRSLFQTVAFAAVCGFCLMLIATGVLPYLIGKVEAGESKMPIPWLPLIWIVGTILFIVVDRMRMGPSAPHIPAAASVGAAAPIPVAPGPVASPKPRRPGKEVSIFVNLVGEGMNILRPVRAQELGHGFYEIVEEMPAGENWEYKTGQVVRCEKKNLSSGKGLVAVDEAPRA